MNVFILLSCARSGSTSLARILDEAVNGRCAVEPVPNLNRETREAMDGRLEDADGIVEATVVARAVERLEEVEVYGEKNVTYGPFVEKLYKRLDCRFVLITRDGRDVVRSLINWHEARFGTIYRECREPGNLMPEAVLAAARLPVHLDTSDYARPRPSPNEPLQDSWEQLDRAQMCAYYWARINALYLGALKKLPTDSWTRIDYTRPSAEEILRVAEFCGLRGLDKERVQALLESKINSLEERGSATGAAPAWQDWDGGARRRFEAIAGDTMRQLGYYGESGAEWRPEGYGSVWKKERAREGWYRWMYEGRQKVHGEFFAWLESREAAGEEIDVIADVGCGVGVGYAERFAKKRYIGVDLSEENVSWCRENRNNPRHEYLALDFVTRDLPELADVVFSSGTIDNAYDIDAFLEALARNSRKWIYATFYRGWFPDLDEHRYAWNPEHGCFYNDVSPRRVREALAAMGCSTILVQPLATGIRAAGQSPYETLVIARVPLKRKM